MNAQPPTYYTRLAPFRKVFGLGNPILTYHKLGPRPRRVRLKGLYLSSRLFAQQMGELKAAGFRSGSLESCTGARLNLQVVITFDDGYVNVLRYGVEPLARAGFSAIQFLPADLLGKNNQWDVALGEAVEPIMDASQVREWLSAGYEIAVAQPDSSLSHAAQSRASARRDPCQPEETRGFICGSIRHFCYPYGDWNEAVRDR